MINDEMIKRINELARKAKTEEGLTDEEKAEQAILRNDYINSVKANLISTIENTYIVDENGKNIITKPSFVRYQYTTELNVDTLLMKQVSSIYKYKTKISDELLKRIQLGAQKSLELEPRWKKYFNLF